MNFSRRFSPRPTLGRMHPSRTHSTSRARHSGRSVIVLALLASLAMAGAASATAPPHADLNPLFAAEWWLRGHLAVTDYAGGQSSSDGIDAIGAWPTSSGENVVVAVVDSGVDLKTPALYGRLLPGRDF